MRLDRAAIGAAMAWQNPALRSQKGMRAVAGWDEDVVTMAAEAARDALNGRASQARAVLLASTSAPFADRLNAGIIAGALDLPRDALGLDLGGSHRAGTSALIAGLALANQGEVIVVAGEARTARAGSQQELANGDAAAAILLGHDNVVARILATASVGSDFIDHWRATGDRYDYQWEERWIREEGYLKLVPEAARAVLAHAGVAASDVAHFILPSPLKGMAKTALAKLGLENADSGDDLSATVGFAGAAHALLMLATVMESAKPGEKILLAGFGSGADAILIEPTDAILTTRPRRGVSGWIAEGARSTDYAKYLSLKGELQVEWGPRSEFGNKFAPTVNARAVRDTLAFVGGRDRQTGVVQFPKTPMGIAPGASGVAEYDDVLLADEPARVVAVTADWLTYHPSPPFYFGLVQFENGARMPMEFVDVADRAIDVGTPVEMTFRIKEIDRMRGHRQYFWKAVPIRRPVPAEEAA
ncbi:MAG: 3-oxoacyl-[acyl-carrier-protein] synthase III C-terminal domain-containing protein [Pseudomonadota bacterium]